jgi:ketosteroid isomerase-like protein
MDVTAGGAEERNIEIIQQCYAHFGSGDVEGVLGLLAEDFVQVMPGNPAVVPWAGTFVGHEGFIDFVTKLGTNAEFLKTEHKEFIAQGDKVVVLFYEQIRAKPTGRVVEFDAVAVWTVREGRITNLDIYEDTALIEKGFL